MIMVEVTIDEGTFGERLKLLYNSWKGQPSSWENANVLAITVGGTSEDLRYLRSIALHLWLFGYELPDTLLLLTPDEVHVLTSQRKAAILSPLAAVALSSAGVKLTVHVKPKQEDGSKQMGELLAIAKGVATDALLGHLPKDKHEGKFFEVWNSTLEKSGLRTTDVAGGVGDLLAVKDDKEILNIKKAAFLASKVMKDFVIVRIEDILDKEKKVKHSKLSEATEEVISDPGKINVKLKADNVDIAYPPVFQSGGKYDLKVSAQSDDSNLHDGIVVVFLGTKYSSYCANIGRTFLIDPTKKQEAEYLALLAAHEAAVKALIEGAKMDAAYEAVVQTLTKLGQEDLVNALTKNVGSGIGLEFREANGVLNNKNDRKVRAGMVFNVSLGVQKLTNPEAKDSKSREYALQIADTVLVKSNGVAPEVLTSQCPKDWDKVSYTLKDDGEEEDEEVVAAEKVTLKEEPNGMHKKTLRHDDPNFKSAEQIRREKQEELLQQKNAETLRRLTAQSNGDAGGGDGAGGRKISEVVAYRTVHDMAPTSDLTIQVDSKNEALLLPIYGIMVPFHITTIKTITSNQDNEHAYVRVSFNFMGAYEPATKFPDCVFLKELSFRSSDVRHATKVVQDVKVLRSSVLQKDRERAERATLVQQEKLIRGKRIYRLPDLWIRPSFGGKGRKAPGALEAHANGFRYSTPKGEALDVMYRNIKHAFFQPAKNEMITILHFHLINPIMVGNKKTKDVQFYAEVMDVVQTLDGGRRNMYDPDEIEEEQRERDRRNKINQEFDMFRKRVQELWDRELSELQLEFDMPFPELGYEGVPHRETVFVQPTVNCLIELTSMPFTVISLEDIEIVNLERVGFNLKNFDMAIIFKDFQRDVIRIDAIPAKRLDNIKEWLTSVKIKYYETKMNLAWKPILKNIMEDPQGFVDTGGWDFLNVDKSDSEDEGEAPSEDYQTEEEDDGSDEEEYSSDDESLVDSDEDGEGSDEDEEDEDEGATWEELEEEAKREDRRRDDLSDSEDERRTKKRKAGGGSGGGGGGAVKRRR